MNRITGSLPPRQPRPLVLGIGAVAYLASLLAGCLVQRDTPSPGEGSTSTMSDGATTGSGTSGQGSTSTMSEGALDEGSSSGEPPPVCEDDASADGGGSTAGIVCEADPYEDNDTPQDATVPCARARPMSRVPKEPQRRRPQGFSPAAVATRASASRSASTARGLTTTRRSSFGWTAQERSAWSTA